MNGTSHFLLVSIFILTLSFLCPHQMRAFNDDVHFGLTYKIGLFAGLAQPDAMAVASGDRGVDYDPHDQPAANVFQRSTPENPINNLHFTFPKVAEAALTLSIAKINGKPGSFEREASLFKVGNGMHSLQDNYSHPHTGTSHKEAEVDLTSFNLDVTWMMARHTLYELLCVKSQLTGKPFKHAEFDLLSKKMGEDISFAEFFLADSDQLKDEALESWGINGSVIAKANKITWVHVGKKRPWNRIALRSGLTIGTSISMMALPVPGARIVGGILTGFFALREAWNHINIQKTLAKSSKKATLDYGAVRKAKSKRDNTNALFSFGTDVTPPLVRKVRDAIQANQAQKGTFKVYWEKHLEEREKNRAESAKSFFHDFIWEKQLTKLKMFGMSEREILGDAYTRGAALEKQVYSFDGGKVKFQLKNLRYLPWVISGSLSSIRKVVTMNMSMAIDKTVSFFESIPQRIRGNYSTWKTAQIAEQQAHEKPAIERDPYSFELDPQPPVVVSQTPEGAVSDIQYQMPNLIEEEGVSLKSLTQKMETSKQAYLDSLMGGMDQSAVGSPSQSNQLFKEYQTDRSRLDWYLKKINQSGEGQNP